VKKASSSNNLLQLLEDLRAQVASLSERLERLERAASPQAEPVLPPEPEPTAAPAPVEEGISEDVVLAISAAVAAFLGVRARIRQIRLITSPAWAQQGRVSIQASHRLH
jgi:methylmalonyl-CoA carboxyltransferase large subunit